MVESQLVIFASAAHPPGRFTHGSMSSKNVCLSLPCCTWIPSPGPCVLWGKGWASSSPGRCGNVRPSPLVLCKRLASPPGLPWTRLGHYLEWPLLSFSASLSCPRPCSLGAVPYESLSHTSLSASDKPPGMAHFPGPSAQPCLQATRHMRAPAPRVTGLCPGSSAPRVWGNLPQVLWLNQLSQEGHPPSQAKSTENQAASRELSPSGPG